MNDVKKLPKFFFFFSSNVLLVVKYSFFKNLLGLWLYAFKETGFERNSQAIFFTVALLFPTV